MNFVPREEVGLLDGGFERLSDEHGHAGPGENVAEKLGLRRLMPV